LGLLFDLRKQIAVLGAYSCISIYIYEKENFKPGNTCGYVYHIDCGLRRKALRGSAATTATGRAATTATAITIN
jgi:hypothetical protein